MSLIQGHTIDLTLADQPLLKQASFRIEAGEHICLLGRNGTGKSSLLKIITGELMPESGDMIRQSGSRITKLMQEVPDYPDKTIFDVVFDSIEIADTDSRDYWQARQHVTTLLDQMDLPEDALFSTLSGGTKRRVLFARTLANNPDLLLLDEPTNHLDLEAILWMESFLLNFKKSLLFVSHDRAFVQKIATCIWDLDRGQLKTYSCTYADYLDRKAADLAAEEKAWERFDKKLAQEEVWIRQGIKARRTRNEGRVLALEKMRKERQQRREHIGKVSLVLDSGTLSGQRVIEARNLTYTVDHQILVKDLSIMLCRGDKLGIIGPNGCGKTTLIRLLLQQLSPICGTVEHGSELRIATLDQLRTGLDGEARLVDVISQGGSDTIQIQGQSKHVMSYLQDFLFTPERARSRVKTLSGGELNRLLLARLFTQPANFLILDEPTNDLDIETLELLEELLTNYPGTLILVSHDRAFLNNIVTSTLAFEGDGRWQEFVGGYDDYLRQRTPPPSKISISKSTSEKEKIQSTPPSTKLSFKERQELEILPLKISELETAIAQEHALRAGSEFYQQSKSDLANANHKLTELEQKLLELSERWEELEARAINKA